MPDVANNGDIDWSHVQDMLDLGGDLTDANKDRADRICNEINADTNLILKRLGFAMPITDADSSRWLELTKKFGATSLLLEALMAQDTEEENTRAQRFWDKYESRLNALIASGGDLLDAPLESDPTPNSVPVLAGEGDDERQKFFLRFPQRAAADQFTDERAVSGSNAVWRNAVRGF